MKFSWKRISHKQSVRWQHLSRLKASAFFSLPKKFAVKKRNNLYLGLGAESSVIEPYCIKKEKKKILLWGHFHFLSGIRMGPISQWFISLGWRELPGPNILTYWDQLQQCCEFGTCSNFFPKNGRCRGPLSIISRKSY